MVTAGPSWESVSNESTNSAMMRKMRQGSSRTKPKVFWFMWGEGRGKGRKGSRVEGWRVIGLSSCDDVVENGGGARDGSELSGGGFGVAGVSRAVGEWDCEGVACSGELERD